MLSTSLLVVSSLTALASADTLIGAYIFHRHGDRTSKSTPPANLTELGYQEVYTSGNYFRDRYVSSAASSKIAGLNSDQVKLGQISVSAPADNVLMSSAIGFAQALYPATQQTSQQTLHNGTVIQTPLDGYQLIPVSTVSTGAGSEDSGWLQDASDCGAAEASSNEYFSTPEYQSLLSSTQGFYNRLSPVINSTFSPSQISYKNAYTIFDYINVATIDNATIPSPNLLDAETLFQLRTLADQHEWNLAYNASSTIRGIAGMQLAAQVVDFFNATMMASSKPRLGIQFGAYGTFTSYFGLTDLLGVQGAQDTTDNFYGVSDYASAMAWELYSREDSPSYPISSSNLYVRFAFHNGTSSNTSEPSYYGLFNQSAGGLDFDDFAANTGRFSIGNTQQWCTACGNSTGTCAQYAQEGSAANVNSSSSGSSNGGMSNAVAGVIGAMVTLGVILLVEAAILLLGGFRLVSKKRLAATGAATKASS